MIRASCSFRTINAGVALVLACITAPALAEGEISMIQIDQMTVGKPPPGFSFARTGRGSDGAWSVVADTTAKGGLAVEQTSTDTTDYRFPLAIHASWSAKNLRAEIKFKAVGGKVDRAGGIAVRVGDPDNYYIARANALENNVRFYRVVVGKRQQLGTADLRVPRANGTRWCSKRKVSAFRSATTAPRCSRSPTIRLPRPAASRCGPSPTA